MTTSYGVKRPSSVHESHETQRSSFEIGYASTDEDEVYILPRSRRIQSEDVNTSRSEFEDQLDDGARSLSTGDSPQKMNPLMFENIDLLNTPLSSLRSCSEYTRYSLQAAQQHARMFEQRTKKEVSFSVVSYVLGFVFPSYKKKIKNRVRFRDSTEDQVFLVEQLRFNEANLLEGEDYNYSTTTTTAINSTTESTADANSNINSRNNSADEGGQNGARNISTSCLSSALIPHFGSGIGNSSCSFDSDSFGNSSNNNRSHRGNRKKRTTIMGETFNALEYVFGIGAPVKKDMPMEIELKTLKAPQYLSVYDTSIPSQEAALDTIIEEERARHLPIGLRRITSLGAFERIRSESIDSTRPSTPGSVPAASVVALDLRNPQTWRPWFAVLVEDARIALRRDCLVHFRSNDIFYECIRIQPFACGSYMRAMLVSGFCNTLFNTYNMVMWPSLEGLSLPHVLLSHCLYATVLFQLTMHVCMLPMRIHVHYLCWEASRAVEVEHALTHIREMLDSESWLVNRMIGTVLDVVALVVLAINEIYLWTTPAMDPLHPLVISLSATTLMTFVMRVVVATLFSLSMHDPQVLSEARRRGLSKWDLAVLPTFVLSCPDEVNNPDCSICLSTFEQGEMLTSLPCDKKHSFHAACIRQWLERQNSCPLCQKLV